MFVEHDVYLALDVKKKDNKCVCGKDIEDINIGYCEECLYKKNAFIDQVVGEIKLDDDFDSLVIEPFESLRVSTIKDIFDYLIDSYVSEHNTLPLKDNDFIVKCFVEKSEVVFNLLNTLDSYINDSKMGLSIKKRVIINSYRSYYNKLNEMYLSDIRLIDAFKKYIEEDNREIVDSILIKQKKG